MDRLYSTFPKVPPAIGLLVLLLACPAHAAPAPAKAEPALAKTEPAPTAERQSADDQGLDVSSFLDQPYGFLPVVIPITEPAVGYGAVAGVAFIDMPPAEQARAGFDRPNVTVIGALGTDNGSDGAFVGDVRHWMDDRLKSLAAVMQASVNLDFYGVGRVPGLQDDPLSYTLETRLAVIQGRYRLGDTPWWAGLGYASASTEVHFDAPAGTPGRPEFSQELTMGALLPLLSYDSRNSPFTPTTGSMLELSAGLFNKGLGSDTDFQRYNLVGIHYRPLADAWFLGVLGSFTTTYGDAPFYMRPYVSMRGIPAMRYQGDQVAQAEAEVRWQFWERYSLVAFGGAGQTRTALEDIDNTRTVLAGGLGFRYELAREYGLHVGLDYARSRDDSAVYVTVGSAWARP